MEDIALLLGAFAGGLFSGYLAAILSFFVWQFIKEGLEDSGNLAIPAMILLSIFGAALFYLTSFVLQSWPMLIGAAITYINGSRPLFKKEE